MIHVCLFFYLGAALQQPAGISVLRLILRVWLHFQGRKSHYQKWLREKPGPWRGGENTAVDLSLWILLGGLGAVWRFVMFCQGNSLSPPKHTADHTHPLIRRSCTFISDPAVKSLCYVKRSRPDPSHTLYIYTGLTCSGHLSTHLSIHPF